MKKLLLIDGNSIINRAYYGLSGGNFMLKNKKGFYTNAIYGFINMINGKLDDKDIDYYLVAFDVREPTFRHKKYDDYKAGRKKQPEELSMQIPKMKEILDFLGIKRLEMSGYEADDIIGTYAKKASQKGYKVEIFSGDKDLFQLIEDNIIIDYPHTRKGSSSSEIYDKEKLNKRYGLKPNQIIDLKALMGDSSDNIPGIKGVGEKTAIKLLKKYNSVDEIYENIDSMKESKMKEKIIDQKEQCYLSKELVQIKTDVDVKFEIEELKRIEINKEKLLEVFNELEFKSFLDKFGLQNEVKVIDVDKKTIKVNNKKQLEKIIETIKKDENLYIHYKSIKKDGKYELSKIIVMSDESENYYLSDNENYLREILEKINDKNLIIYDSKPFLNIVDDFDNNNIFDVSVVDYLIEPSENNDTIEELYEKQFNEKIYEDSDMQLSLLKENNDEKEDIKYAKYLKALKNLYMKLNKQINEKELADLYNDIEKPLIFVIAQMEKFGICVDKDKLNTLGKQLEEALKNIEENIYSYADEEFNINSPKQLGNILFEKLSLPVIKKTKTGYSTNHEVLMKLKGRHEIISEILEYRQLEKLRSTYYEGLKAQISKDNKIYSTFNQKITTTGRISSTDPNLQNIPIKLEKGREFRKIFVSSDNHILVDADYSQIELRVLAHISQDEIMINAFNNNEDIHTRTAMNIFNVDKEDVTNKMRTNAKTVNFSVIYGISPYSLSNDLNISVAEAKEYIEQYFNKYSKVKEYMDNIKKQAKEQGYVRTLFNRIRYLHEINSSNYNVRSFWERVAMNTPIQGTAADIIKMAMNKVFYRMKNEGLKSNLILQVHDELMVDAVKTEKEKVIEILRDEMQNVCKLDVPLKVDLKYGDNWYEAK